MNESTLEVLSAWGPRVIWLKEEALGGRLGTLIILLNTYRLWMITGNFPCPWNTGFYYYFVMGYLVHFIPKVLFWDIKLCWPYKISTNCLSFHPSKCPFGFSWVWLSLYCLFLPMWTMDLLFSTNLSEPGPKKHLVLNMYTCFVNYT
jgi:hypothetical protein